MEMMGAQISSLLAMSPLDPLVPVLCEAMTDTSDLQDLLGLSDSDSDDTLVGSPPGSPMYSVTFPASPLEGLAERLVALPEAAADTVAEGTDVCFHDGSVPFELDDKVREQARVTVPMMNSLSFIYLENEMKYVCLSLFRTAMTASVPHRVRCAP